MKSHAEEILRWVTILVCAGGSAWQLAASRYALMGWNSDWLTKLFQFSIHALLAGPFLAGIYFCFRREYRKLFLVLGAVGAIFLFCIFMALPERLGIDRYFENSLSNLEKVRVRSWINFLAGPYYVLAMFGPIIIAAWFYRVCRYLAYHKLHILKEGEPHDPKTRSTRWLLWVGVLCMMLPSVAGLFITFNNITSAYSPDQMDEWLYWTVGLGNIGILLLFLGLVRRRPVPVPTHK